MSYRTEHDNDRNPTTRNGPFSWSRFGRWFALAIVLTAAAAFFGSMFLPGAWYASIRKPDWNPPNALFGPVWSVLYLMIAVAGGLVLAQAKDRLLPALWILQLVLNGLWSYLFFGLKNPTLGLVEITLLWLSIGVFIAVAWRAQRRAALLMVPYWLWVTFAAALNFAIWRLNAQSL